MSAALTNPAKASVPLDAERGRLVELMRKLMEYGRDLIATLQACNTPTPPPEIARSFASLNLALIIARITRGLMLAGVLEKRLLHPRPRPAAPVERKASSAPRAPRRPRIEDDDAELRGRMPTAREIAERVRNRKTGAVVVEICRDLGIACDHPLWRDIWKAIAFHGGRMANMMRIWTRRSFETLGLDLPDPPEPPWERWAAADARPP